MHVFFRSQELAVRTQLEAIYASTWPSEDVTITVSYVLLSRATVSSSGAEWIYVPEEEKRQLETRKSRIERL